jgi:hypothetical protein
MPVTTEAPQLIELRNAVADVLVKEIMRRELDRMNVSPETYNPGNPGPAWVAEVQRKQIDDVAKKLIGSVTERNNKDVTIENRN